MVKRFILSLAVLLLSLSLQGADMTTTVTLANYSLLSHVTETNFSVTSISTGEVAFYAKSSEVIGELALSGYWADTVVLEIPRGYIKVRFPWLRITAGKTRLSWGEGFVFNAGDLLFDGMSLNLNIASSVLRDETTVLAAASKYWGRYSFVEAVFLPGAELGELPSMPGVKIPLPTDIADTSAGIRFHTRVLDTSIETGYLYRGSEKTHNPYLSLHGDLFGFMDIYASGSLAMVQDNVDAELIKESVKISAGFFKQIGVGKGQNINITLESGIFPFKEWEEVDPDPLPHTYGLYLYPELSLSLSDTVGIQLRALLSPIEGCGMLFASTNWDPIQGLTVGLAVGGNFGDENDLYSQERANNYFFMLQTRYKFGN